MPLHEFLCLECGHIMEELVNSSNPEPESCRHCASAKLDKLISSPGGYHIYGSNSGSTRPKNSGSFKRAKK